MSGDAKRSAVGVIAAAAMRKGSTFMMCPTVEPAKIFPGIKLPEK